MPALVFEWNEAGFNDVPNAPGLRNGISGQNKAAIITNLITNGATGYNNDLTFTFPSGSAIGEWINQIRVNLPWVKNQRGVQNVCNSITRINQITDNDCGCADTPSTVFDIENFSYIFNG
ncbi:8639_t:CDS:2 [Dentiscutata erythropus]|uniref:8639_t:CDS:1 n=1 Tax=Dentiscutata erythropus TaxID=1348616 RepID=A0A9N8WG47_9GLOM|nr:8639_t:CDS:2 [Dentiscutata erythropus]